MAATKEEVLRIARLYLEELQRQEEELKRQIFDLQQRYNMVHQEIKSLKWFLTLGEQELNSEIAATIVDEPYGPSEIKDEIAKILAEVYPGTLHYKKIMEKLNERGIFIGGKNPMQNLLSYLSRDDRFVRGEKRGEYRLKNVVEAAQKTIA